MYDCDEKLIYCISKYLELISFHFQSLKNIFTLTFYHNYPLNSMYKFLHTNFLFIKLAFFFTVNKISVKFKLLAQKVFMYILVYEAYLTIGEAGFCVRAR